MQNYKHIIRHNQHYDAKQMNQMIKEKYKDINEMKTFIKDSRLFNEEFELLKYINSGACGIVYEGKAKKANNERVAMKFILNKILDNKRDKMKCDLKEKRFIQLNKEITLQNRLKHKNIISLYAVYQMQNDSTCIVMELGQYGDLECFQKKLQRKQLSESMLGYITKQILDGLYHCHQNKIIHMDIKHQNILIDKDLRIKLADMSVSFSYAHFPPNSQITLPLAGTSLFMSPEVLGKKEIMVEDCNKVDIFSLGTLLYSLAFSEYPYQLNYSDKKNFERIKEKIAKNDITFPSNHPYSQMFSNFLFGLLNKKLNKRFSIEEALKDPWIKGVDYIIWEKEKIDDNEKFLINCIADNIKLFNDYINK